jgi:hypothetical protein
MHQRLQRLESKYHGKRPLVPNHQNLGSVRCTPMRHMHEMQAYEVHAYEVYPHEMHARKMHVHEMHAHEVHAREVHAREVLRVVDL